MKHEKYIWHDSTFSYYMLYLTCMHKKRETEERKRRKCENYYLQKHSTTAARKESVAELRRKWRIFTVLNLMELSLGKIGHARICSDLGSFYYEKNKKNKKRERERNNIVNIYLSSYKNNNYMKSISEIVYMICFLYPPGDSLRARNKNGLSKYNNNLKNKTKVSWEKRTCRYIRTVKQGLWIHCTYFNRPYRIPLVPNTRIHIAI